MTGEGGAAGSQGQAPRLSLMDRIGVLQRWVLRLPIVRRVSRLLAAYGDADGPLLASGLAFNALFAIIPALLFLVGLLGFLIGDPVRAQEIVESIVERVPALEDLADALLNGVVSAAGTFSIIGIIGFAWGASGFYGSLDTAMRRLFPGGTRRDQFQRRIRGLIAVLGLVGAAVLSVVMATAISVLDRILSLPGLDTARLLSIVGLMLLFVVVVWITYVIVPTAGPGPRLALLPAVVAGTAIGSLTALFGVLAPFLIGSVAGLGALAAIFGALVWLRFSFEILLYGAAWARIRRDGARRTSQDPTLDEV